MRPDSAGAYLERAERALSSGRTLSDDGDTVGACNRAYYAMFYAAHAALWVAGAQPAGAVLKTHHGLISMFGQKLVVAQRIDAEHGRAFARVQRTRLLADYTAEPPTDQETELSLRLAEAFVAAVKRSVSQA